MRFAGIGIIVAGVLAMGGFAKANTADEVPARPPEPLELPSWNPDAPATGPVQLIVSVPEQRVSVYVGGRLIANSPVSTGQEGFSTPTGVFSILQKKKFHWSNIYSGAPMPFMQRLTWSGIALHASNQVPDYPASHGCVRLPPEFAKKLFGFTEMGAHVVVSGGETTPLEINHRTLFQPIPLHLPTATEARIVVAESQRSNANPGATKFETAKLVAEVSANEILPRDIGAEARSTKADLSHNVEPTVRILVTRRTGCQRRSKNRPLGGAKVGHFGDMISGV